MKTKHTPGPWQIENADERGKVLVSVPRNDGTIFKSAWIAQVGPYSDDDAANARLISAAPEMLEALNDIAADLGDLMRHAGSESTREQASTAHARARAAIAKARGE